MATPTFPNIIPSSRKLTLGELPVKQYRSMSGAVVRRAYGNTKTNYVLELEFKNIGNTSPTTGKTGSALEILQHYEDANTTFSSFAISGVVLKGMVQTFADKVSPSGIFWRYAEPPKVTSVKTGLSTVSVKLIGEFDD
jgi:hypothetical protein